MSDVVLSKGQKQATDISALLRARNPLIWIVTREEARVEGFLAEACVSAGYVPNFWDVAQGFTNVEGKTVSQGTEDPGAALTAIRNKAEDKNKKERGVWIMRDLPIWLNGPSGAAPLRQLRNLARLLPGVKREQSQAIIVITTESKVPDELAGHATVIEWSLPDRSEIAAILDAAINSLPEFAIDPTTGKPDTAKPIRSVAAPNGTRDAAIDAAVGLTGEEAASCYAKSLVQTKRIDPAVVSNEKRRVISREKVLEWYEPIPGGLDAVGGLEKLKSWIVARKLAFSPAAKEYGLPSPKGMLAVGVTGCGKSLVAKATATALGVPLLKLDLGALKAKYVGDSESNIRKAFKVIEAIGRCVVWVDEIEKQMAGSSSGASDGGVSADALGVVLNWMQERTSEAFIIATANDITGLPPELFRKGRFDEIWYVGLPNEVERVAVLKASLKVYKREALALDFEAIADACDRFTGAEIAEIVPAAMYAAFAENARQIDTADLIAAAKDVHKVADSAGDKIAALNKWAKENARSASAAVVETSSFAGGRKLDLDAA